MENSVERQTEDLNKAATYAVEQSDEIRTALRLQASELIDASNRASDRAKEMGTLFRDYTDDLSEASDPPQNARNLSASDWTKGPATSRPRRIAPARKRLRSAQVCKNC